MKRTLSLIVCLALMTSGLSFSQNSPTPKTATPTDVAAELQQMKAMLQQQQQQIDALKEQLAAQQQNGPTQAHAPSLGQVASTTPVLPPVRSTVDAALPAQAMQAPNPTPPQQASNTINLAQGKLQIGATAYADWGWYPQTGFGPVFLDTPHTYLGPGNDNYNAFNLNRTYINFLFSPTDWVTFRVTPDIYRDISGAPGVTLSPNTSTGATANGSLNWRLKYGYAEFHKIFGDGAFKDDNIRFGQQTNPLIDWDEALNGYRFVYLAPWNFISLSSTYTGVSINGPIKGKNGKQYLDYQVGIFNNSNFHAYELSESKTVMARASLYPMGATSRFQGLGLTGFIDYGYNNAIPSALETPVVRGAALVHYMTPKNGGQIVFEYDFGRNAMSSGNLFGGSGSPTGAFVNLGDMASGVFNGRNTKQQGFDVYGHIKLGPSKWDLFGLYQDWQPNTNIAQDPFDFRRTVLGLSYTVNKNVRLALDNQNVLYKRDQFTYPAAAFATFAPAATAAKYPAGVPNAVPKSVKAVFLNMEFTF